MTDQTTLSAEEEARHVKNPYAPYCLWDSEPWPCSVSRLLDAARERPSALDVEALKTPCANCHHPLGWCASGEHYGPDGRPCFCEEGPAILARLTEPDAGEAAAAPRPALASWCPSCTDWQERYDEAPA